MIDYNNRIYGENPKHIFTEVFGYGLCAIPYSEYPSTLYAESFINRIEGKIGSISKRLDYGFDRSPMFIPVFKENKEYVIYNGSKYRVVERVELVHENICDTVTIYDLFNEIEIDTVGIAEHLEYFIDTTIKELYPYEHSLFFYSDSRKYQGYIRIPLDNKPIYVDKVIELVAEKISSIIDCRRAAASHRTNILIKQFFGDFLVTEINYRDYGDYYSEVYVEGTMFGIPLTLDPDMVKNLVVIPKDMLDMSKHTIQEISCDMGVLTITFCGKSYMLKFDTAWDLAETR